MIPFDWFSSLYTFVSSSVFFFFSFLFYANRIRDYGTRDGCTFASQTWFWIIPLEPNVTVSPGWMKSEQPRERWKRLKLSSDAKTILFVIFCKTIPLLQSCCLSLFGKYLPTFLFIIYTLFNLMFDVSPIIAVHWKFFDSLFSTTQATLIAKDKINFKLGK